MNRNYLLHSLKQLGEGLYELRHIRYGRQWWTLCKVRKNHKCTIHMEDFASSGDMPLGKAQGAGRSISLAPSSHTRFGCPPGTYSSGKKFSYALVTLEWPMDVFNFSNMPTQLVDPDTSNNQSIYHYPKNYKPFGK